MLRKIALFFAVMLIPVIAAASGDIGKDSWTYKDIKSLVDTGVITKPLVQDSLSREEVVGYINDGVHNVLAANRGFGIFRAVRRGACRPDRQTLQPCEGIYDRYDENPAEA